MSARAAPSGSSRYVAEVDLFPYMARLVEQQESTLAAQQQLIEQLKQIACGPGFIKEDESKESDEEPPLQDERLPGEIRLRRLTLYRAALNGDWAVAKGIYDKYEDEIRVGITIRGDTALHVAAAANRVDFVKELLKMMNGNKDLANNDNITKSTALFFAAGHGTVELAKETMKDNKSIAMIPDVKKEYPIGRAISVGHKDMVEFLYEQTDIDSLPDGYRIELFVKLIETDLYAVALRLLGAHKELATKRYKEETALHVLARKNLTSSNPVHQKSRGIFQRYLNLGARNEENQPALELVELLWKEVVLLSDKEIKELIKKPRGLISDAAKQGNIQFLLILIREFPDLIWKLDENRHSIFHVAVLNRMENVFKFIKAVQSNADLIVDTKDKRGNNILHLAGKLAPPHRLNVVSGPALQMQRELLWFKAVEDFVPRKLTEAENDDRLTPKALFSKEHRDLKEKGEKWMKDTASSCMIVATLIAAVVFAAAITVPGGNNADTGLPLFLHNVSFKIFAVSNMISLVASTLSIVNFLSLVAPHYEEKDFRISLPRKLLVGLGTLFIAIAAMMVVFSATSFIVFTDGSIWIAILAIVVPSAPAILFVYQHFRLFDDLLRSILQKDYLIPKCEASLLTLFYKEGETKVKQQKKTKQFNGNLTIQCACSTNVQV